MTPVTRRKHEEVSINIGGIWGFLIGLPVMLFVASIFLFIATILLSPIILIVVLIAWLT